MIPTAATRTVVAEEMPAVLAWVARRPGWTARFDEPQASLAVTTTHPADGSPLYIAADLTGYRAIPPGWRFLDPTSLAADSTGFPQPGTTALLPSSIFHPNRVICAPWNRLAYAEHGGPHGDWGTLTSWTSAGQGSTQAHTLADMLSQIALHLTASPGVGP